ncbi:hypothetical protein B0H11DRAFT_1708032 [Mycena galericulata]|nr:hypothetical protein B0H11DRAFT_1708032 [Mycena galericulata]
MIIDSTLGIIIKDSKPERVCQWIDCPDRDPERKMKMCVRCEAVRYCANCQRSDWSGHKLYCRTPPILDLGQWLTRHYDLFHWALIDALSLRSNPANLRNYGLWVNLKRGDRMINGGLSPSPFLLDSVDRMPFESMAKLSGGIDFARGAERVDQLVAEGGIGTGIVVFCVISGRDATFRIQHHTIKEISPGRDSPTDAGWKGIVKGVVNGDIKISSLSRMIEGGE